MTDTLAKFYGLPKIQKDNVPLRFFLIVQLIFRRKQYIKNYNLQY